MDAQAELESIVVRIDVDGQPLGTGFVAADDLQPQKSCLAEKRQ
jgi:hypothetical protein